ncbi:MAG: hypothetical protein ACI93R_001279 [Flavobacteriales bacterium]|jgi:hypothetical protein
MLKRIFIIISFAISIVESLASAGVVYGGSPSVEESTVKGSVDKRSAEKSSAGKHLSAKIPSSGTMDFKIPPGNVFIEGVKSDIFRAELTATCPKNNLKCTYYIDNLALTINKSGEHYVVSTNTAYKKNNYNAKLEFHYFIPENSATNIDLSAGNLHIKNVTSCLGVTLAAGNINIVSDKSLVSTVELEAAAGNTQISANNAGNMINNSRTNLVGSKSNWRNGTGSCDLRAKVKAGNVEVNLI